jgi:uncharacterized glyoxalase superfamily protein PhnB
MHSISKSPNDDLDLPVEDVDAMCTELATRGVKLLNGSVDRPWGVRTASFNDPSGNIWEITKVIETEYPS